MEQDSAARAWHFKQLRWSLQGLASTAASPQRELFPEYALAADELALQFDHWFTVIRSHYEGELSSAQLESLQAIDRKLSTMSRDGAEFDVELWTETALVTSEHWMDIRRLAAAALEAFEWPAEGSFPSDGYRGAATAS
jgi:hypothetical protein